MHVGKWLRNEGTEMNSFPHRGIEAVPLPSILLIISQSRKGQQGGSSLLEASHFFLNVTIILEISHTHYEGA